MDSKARSLQKLDEIAVMPKSSPTLDTIVFEAVEIADHAQRSKYLADACADDAPLRERAEALIAAHFRAGRFLAEPTTPAEAGDQTGAIIGPYRLLEQIGEGGMGVVYVAEQSEPVKRRVALKIVKPGLDTREVVGRFNAERQALALMDHPNIAKILDAGTIGEPEAQAREETKTIACASGSPRPFFVMELVRGLPMTKYCDDARLPTDRRLHLFVQVCRAVQHAHQKGIIHRDLKPSNILVTMQDGEPAPRVIDFGVAKAMNPEMGGQSVYTKFTQLIGTPLYMSPEQAELSSMDVDTRSDVYSLGVLLYELLTGTTPFDPHVIQDAGFDEMRRMIREDEPPRPSARLSTLDAQARSTVSSQRGLDDRQLSRLLSGDLDWIVMKALEKDRNRRYESAGTFAADVERYLAHEPVEARPPSKAYRLKKFVRRNRGKLAAATVLLAAMITVAGTLGWTQWNAARRQAMVEQAVADALADANRFEEQRKWADARAAVERAEAALGDTRRADVDDRLRVHTLLQRFENIQFDSFALVSHGEMNRKTGISSYGEAFREFGLDVANLESTSFAQQLPSGRVRNEIVGALDDWARLQRRYNPKDDGWKKAIAAARAADTDPWSDRLRLAWIEGPKADRTTIRELSDTAPLNNLHPITVRLMSDLLTMTDDYPKAIELLKKSLRQRPDNYSTIGNLVWVLQRTKPPRLEESLGYLRAALAVRPGILSTHTDIASTLEQLQRHDEAIATYEQILHIKPDFYVGLNSLAILLRKKGELDRAESYLRQAIRVAPEKHPAHHNLGLIQYQRGDFQDAAKSYQEAARLEPSYAKAHLYHGHALLRLGQHSEALTAYQEALRLEPSNWEMHNAIGMILYESKKDVDGAISAYREAIKLRPKELSSEMAAQIAKVHARLSVPLRIKGQLEESVIELQTALQLDKKLTSARKDLSAALIELGKTDDAIIVAQEGAQLDPTDAYWQFLLGNAYLKAKQFERAIAPFRESSRLNPNHAQSFCNLGYALKQTRQYREALAAYRHGHELGSKIPGWNLPSAKWIKECEALLEAAEKSKQADPPSDKPPSR